MSVPQEISSLEEGSCCQTGGWILQAPGKFWLSGSLEHLSVLLGCTDAKLTNTLIAHTYNADQTTFPNLKSISFLTQQIEIYMVLL